MAPAAVTSGPATISLEDVQGLILRGFGALKVSCYLTLRIDDVAGARAWLREIANEVTSAAAPVAPTDRHLNIAFSSFGLARLGLPAATLAGFRSAFLEGAAGEGVSPSSRSRALGDVGESAPTRWHWGNVERPIDIALLLFAGDADGIVEFARWHRDRAAKRGLAVIGEFHTFELPDHKEHFGFRDGIAQPRLRNANAAAERPGVLEAGRPENTVEPGEFLFGYRNEYGAVASGPVVPPALDAKKILPSIEDSPERDFARNGSFLVWRQLEEHVQNFWQAVRNNAENDPAARRKLAAKFFGRWPSGAPLALAPEIEDESLRDADNFSYADDPYGYRTPFGAHIRRGNPRDWHLAPKPEQSRAIANKHRIIRRGRPYGPPVRDSMDPEDILAANADSEERGVHFLCFMADIERQFEMIQSTWLNDEKFGGLYDELDPMLGAHAAHRGAFTVQATPMRSRLVGLSRFVTVRGAAYLFMPSLAAVRFLGELKE